MKLSKYSFIVLFSFLLLVLNAKAQSKTELILRANMGIGADYNSLDYRNPTSSGSVLYSPGGGMGLEFGLGYFPINNIEVYGTVGYQQNLALQFYSSTSGGTDKTSFTFNKSSVLLGANYKFRFSGYDKMGLKVGGGVSYNIPGTMSITELNYEFEDLKFSPGFGFHLELGMFYELNKWTIIPSIRYRGLNFHSKDNIQSSVSRNHRSYYENMNTVNASGVDLSITLRRELSKK